ncbi:MAG: ral nucleoside transport system permease protein [Thermoleophilaceae bacterium]|jgi:simple sugar transport system permease protein|nr:ral nucleoside transport system permease protein [Thermoleophilaceae bacterium]
MSTSVAAGRQVAISARAAAWTGITLGVLAAYVALPPLMIRTPVVPLLLAAAGVAAGVYATREGEKRLGWIAVAVAVLGAILAVMAVKSGESNLDRVFVWSALTAGMLRYATPLIFGAMGGILSERSGVINIGLEGMMLIGAFFGIFGSDLFGSWFLGVLVGIAAGALIGLVHAFVSIRLRADQVVSGTGINFLAIGITGYVFIYHYGDQGTPSDISRAPNVTLPLVEDIPFIGEAIGHMNVLTWAALLIVPILSVFLFRTRGGLRLRSVGEKPRAADSLGLPVLRTRYLAVTASGALAAVGGVFLSIGLLGSFNEQMTAGRGFIALAAVIFGSWRPFGALAGALLFGFSTALAQRLPAFSESTAVLFQALPYVLTLVVVAGVIGRSRPPAAVGVPYVKE